MKFWNDDSKVVDDFTPEDKYFFLYLMTNPHTSLTGCYEISFKTMARETGYNEETVRRLTDRMERVHKVICYDPETKEVLVVNWHKYNWTTSEKLLQSVRNQVPYIRSKAFREYVEGLANGDTVSIPYQYGMDTSISASVTDTVSVSIDKTKDKKKVKHKYGEYQHVLLTDDEYQKLKEKYPKTYEEKIKELDEAIERKGYKYNSHYLTILKWARDNKTEEKEEKSVQELARELGWDV